MKRAWSGRRHYGSKAWDAPRGLVIVTSTSWEWKRMGEAGESKNKDWTRGVETYANIGEDL